MGLWQGFKNYQNDMRNNNSMYSMWNSGPSILDSVKRIGGMFRRSMPGPMSQKHVRPDTYGAGSPSPYGDQRSRMWKAYSTTQDNSDWYDFPVPK